MPRRRQINGLDVLDDLIETAVGTVFDKGAEYIERVKTQQAARLPAEAQTQAYTCMSCKRSPFTLLQMEVISAPMPGYGMCKGCFAFVWKAGEEKVKFLARKAAEGRGGVRPPAAPPQTPPWDILGIKPDATVEEVKKAWKTLAAKSHPDMVPPGAPSEEKEAARLRFEELTRARDAMLKVRQAAT